MSNLSNSEGWAVLCRYAARQSEVRTRNVVHTPCVSMEAVFEQEYEKGEISGIFLIMNLPEVLQKELKVLIKEREAKLPLEPED